MAPQTRTIEEREDLVVPWTRQRVKVENKSGATGPSAAAENDEGKDSWTMGVGSTSSAMQREIGPPQNSDRLLVVVVANTTRVTMEPSSSVRCTRAAVANGTSCAMELLSSWCKRFPNRAFGSSFGASCGCGSEWFVVRHVGAQARGVRMAVHAGRWKNQTMVPPQSAVRPT
jgi:hypothetical protein